MKNWIKQTAIQDDKIFERRLYRRFEIFERHSVCRERLSIGDIEVAAVIYPEW